MLQAFGLFICLFTRRRARCTLAYRVRYHIIYARLNLVKLQEALDDADDIQF